MKKLSFFILFLFLFSCRTMPAINPPDDSTDKNLFSCPDPFLKEGYRFIHAIEYRTAGHPGNSMIGVTVADPVLRSLSCAMMTAEGMVLFEAETAPDGIKISRAIPPFDSEVFAKNMIDDIRLIFMKPEGNLRTIGYLADGSKNCRYREKNGDVTDVIENKFDGMAIKRYSSSGELERHVRLIKTTNPYQTIELLADETFDYSLLMNLIEAQPVKKQAFKRK